LKLAKSSEPTSKPKLPILPIRNWNGLVKATNTRVPSLPILPIRNWNPHQRLPFPRWKLLPILPIRNWNLLASKWSGSSRAASNPTYKELKRSYGSRVPHRRYSFQSYL